jgi:hypothetical protein
MVFGQARGSDANSIDRLTTALRSRHAQWEGISWGRCRMHYSDLISRSSASTSRIRRGSRHAISQEIEVESWKNKRVLRCPLPCPATKTVLPSARPLSDDPPPSLANGKTQPRRGGLGFLIRPWHIPKVPRSSCRLSSTPRWIDRTGEAKMGAIKGFKLIRIDDCQGGGLLSSD